MPLLATVVDTLERLFPPSLAEPWDAIGLVCGDPDAEVRKALFAVDPVATVADRAVEVGADLIVTHHPLFLRPVSSVAATTPKGRLVHRLVSNGIGLYVAHTNADKAAPGVNDALAALLGLADLRPLVPYTADGDGPEGLGRIGRLTTPEPLSAFVRRVAQCLPSTVPGVRATGDPDAIVSTVAVCGGSGDSLLETVRAADIDAFVTADLRHHPSSEAAEAGGPALVDVAHWASEWPWLPDAARAVAAELSETEARLETYIFQTPTDPWIVHEQSREPGATAANGGSSTER